MWPMRLLSLSLKLLWIRQCKSGDIPVKMNAERIMSNGGWIQEAKYEIVCYNRRL